MEQKFEKRFAQGTAGEMIVCADLLLRGFQVFRAIGHYESFDVTAYKDGRFLRVQIKTGLNAPIVPGKQDIVAWVDVKARTIEYTPLLLLETTERPKRAPGEPWGRIYDGPNDLVGRPFP